MYKRDWHNQIPYEIWEYQTSIRTSIEETPFSLFYGDDVQVPLKLEIPSLRISLHGDIPNEEAR